MKNIYLIAFCFHSMLAFSQTISKETELSNADKFSSKAGTLIQKEFIDIGKINKAEVKVIVLTDMISNESVNSLRFEYAVTSSYSTDTKVASLDSDEIDGLLKSIKLIQDKVFALTPKNYTEVTYRSRGGFEAGCFWSKGNWSTYLKLEQYDSKSYVFLKKSDFPSLLALIENAKSIMNQN